MSKRKWRGSGLDDLGISESALRDLDSVETAPKGIKSVQTALEGIESVSAAIEQAANIKTAEASLDTKIGRDGLDANISSAEVNRSG